MWLLRVANVSKEAFCEYKLLGSLEGELESALGYDYTSERVKFTSAEKNG
jgi:hypothetical protein